MSVNVTPYNVAAAIGQNRFVIERIFDTRYSTVNDKAQDGRTEDSPLPNECKGSNEHFVRSHVRSRATTFCIFAMPHQGPRTGTSVVSIRVLLRGGAIGILSRFESFESSCSLGRLKRQESMKECGCPYVSWNLSDGPLKWLTNLVTNLVTNLRKA
ncbi:PREDICTED: uncharacterized protein LOC108554995 isoform X2 [Eufriesea mexicana]|uniref:uncharacterized protein LOC108554995 isoform X2 n=1 Tax=Eufriesea mexicana TaxID=516756 RepID=UPI00083C756E|nr:PREDICTED: uncharacterized protein LOC108554995 isoform X2 [Eufriesea mexicana]